MFNTSSDPLYLQEIYNTIDFVAEHLKQQDLSIASGDTSSITLYPSTRRTATHSTFLSTTSPSTTTPQKQSIHSFHSPLAWRSVGAQYGLTSLDVPFTHFKDIFPLAPLQSQQLSSSTTESKPSQNSPQHVGKNLSTLDLVRIFIYAGRISLNLRDCLGLGHGRLLLPWMQSILYSVQDEIDAQKCNGDEVTAVTEKMQLLKKQYNYTKSVIKNIIDGSAYMAISITELDAGSDVNLMSTSSVPIINEKTGTIEGFNISGEKHFNARLEQCSHIILFSKNEDNPSMNVFCIPIEEYLTSQNPYNISQKNITILPGITITNTPCYGLHGNSFGGITIDNIIVPPQFLIGSLGSGHSLFRTHFALWRLLQVAASLGTSIQALIDVVQFSRERMIYSKPLMAMSHVQMDFANISTRLHMGQLLLTDIANRIDIAMNGMDSSHYYILDDYILTQIAMAKAQICDDALAACMNIQQIYGARGYTLENDIGQRILDLQGLSIADGASNFCRSLICRHLFGEDFWAQSTNQVTYIDNLNREKLVSAPENVQTSLKDHNTILNTNHFPNTRQNQLNPQHQSPKTLILASNKIISRVLNDSTQNGLNLLKMSEYDHLVCKSGGGTCISICMVNLISIMSYNIDEQYNLKMASFFQKTDKTLITSKKYRPITLIEPLSLMYPEILYGILYTDAAVYMTKPHLGPKSPQEIENIERQDLFIPYIPLNTAENDDILNETGYHNRNPIIHHETLSLIGIYRQLQPLLNCLPTDKNLILYYPIFSKEKSPYKGYMWMKPLQTLFYHGRLSNHTIIWFFHVMCIHYLTQLNNLGYNNHLEANNPKKDFHWNQQHPYLKKGYYYISVYEHSPVLDDLVNIYPPKDEQLWVEQISDQNKNNEDEKSCHIIEDYSMLHHDRIKCSCAHIDASPSNPQNNEHTRDDKLIYNETLFTPLYARPLEFAINNDIRSIKDMLPLGFDFINPYHNTFVTRTKDDARRPNNYTVDQFYNHLSLINKTPVDNFDPGKTVVDVQQTMVSFNFYKKNTKEPRQSRIHKYVSSDVDLVGRHCQVIKEAKWVDIVDHTGASCTELVVMTCDPANPTKNYMFVIRDCVYNIISKGANKNEYQCVEFIPYQSIASGSINTSPPTSSSTLRLVNSMFNINYIGVIDISRNDTE